MNNQPRLGNYTVVYECNGTRREFYTMARSVSHAVITAQELLPSCAEIVRTYHDPSWE